MSEYLEKSKVYKGFHYSVLSTGMLRYLHSTALKMLTEVIAVFHQYNIRYFICGGTLLGAVTSQKFIPWDDDVDICILDEDYEEALKLLVGNIPDWMCVQCPATEPNYYHGWAKVRDRNSHIYPDSGSYRENGVWIDLYRLSQVPKKQIPYLIVKEHLDYLDRRCRVGDISAEERDKRIAENRLTDRLENERARLARMNEEDEKETAYLIWSASKIVVDAEWVLPRKRYMFEGISLYGFHDPEPYLTRHYGTGFRTLPPEELRRVGINKIDYQGAEIEQ